MQEVSQAPIRWGFAAVALGAIAVTAAFTVIFAGPFAPVQDIGVGLGEIAGDAIKSTLREVLNRPQPAPIAPVWTVDDTLWVAVAAMSALTITLAALSYALERPNIPARFALAMGASALVILWLSWLALLVCGVLLITMVLAPISEGIGGVFGGIGAFFAGIFGG